MDTAEQPWDNARNRFQLRNRKVAVSGVHIPEYREGKTGKTGETQI
jgi:hypothetical protein